jgi:translation initiation factor IF-3
MSLKEVKNRFQNRINDDLIKEQFVYLVEDTSPCKMVTWDARKKAELEGLDLVEVGTKDDLPLCKIFSYEKFIYEQKKKKQKQKGQEIKEIQLSANIGDHDLNVKVNAAKRFVQDNDKVKLVLKFKGRENANKEYNKRSILAFIVACEDFAIPESMPKTEGNKCFCILKPKNKI